LPSPPAPDGLAQPRAAQANFQLRCGQARYQQQQIAFAGLIAVIVAAFLLVFALLLYLYRRFDFAVAIILMPILAMPAVFIGLWVTGIQLNITAMMGMTMVVGIVTEVAIFYFSEYEALLVSRMRTSEARRVNRFRPIAMTTLAAILASRCPQPTATTSKTVKCQQIEIGRKPPTGRRDEAYVV
jgi:multidrug efflux pump subunit AcrB